MGQKETKRRSAPERDRDTRGERRLHAAEPEPRAARSPDAAAVSAPTSKGRGPTQELTTANKIMVAAARLDEERETFTAEDLIVVAWKQFPESFGLTGYRDTYPDSNRVLSKLMGSVGLCSRGWLEQVSTKTYKMTQSGRKLVAGLRTAVANHVTPPAPEGDTGRSVVRKVERASGDAGARSAPVREISRGEPTPSRRESVQPVTEAVAPARAERAVAAVAEPKPRPAVPAVAPPVAAPRPAPVQPAVAKATGGSDFEGTSVLQRLATSAASQKFTRGGMVTFADACQFWAITPGTNPVTVPPRLSENEQVLKRAENHIHHTGAPIRVNDRIEVTLTTVIGLSGLHRMLMQKYYRELDNIRGRMTEPNSHEDEG